MIDAIGTVFDYLLSFATAVIVVVIGGLIARRTPLHRLLRVLHRPLWQSMVMAASVSLMASIAVFAFRGEPLPFEHDEHSHLLVASTLGEGRLANPPHPLWPHFETPNALQQPAYASAYPLGSGLLLAIGALIGLPIAGLWLASAAASAATVWAARAFTTPAWALLAGLAIALHPTVTGWSTVYHGGSLPAFAGALLLGAAARLCIRPTARMAALAAAAVAVLANSRPWEGLMLTIAVAAFVLVSAPRLVPRIARVSGLALLILAAGLAVVAIHNRAVTGSVFELPHTRFDRTYNRAPNFVWEAPHPPKVYRNEEMRALYGTAYWNYYRRLAAPGGWWRMGIADKLARMRDAAFPPPTGGIIGAAFPLVFLPLLVLPWSLRRRRTRRLLLVVAIFLIAPFGMVWWISSQYLGAAAAVAAILYVVLARELAARFRSRAATIVFAAIVFAVLLGIQAAMSVARTPHHWLESERTRMIRELAPGRHLILVPAGIHACTINPAGIDGARVVWARELGGPSDAALLRYFADRRVWRLQARGERLLLEDLGHARQ